MGGGGDLATERGQLAAGYQSERAKVQKSHPDEDYLMRGIEHGFRIDSKYEKHTCQSAGSNLQSARTNPKVIEEYLTKEVGVGGHW